MQTKQLSIGDKVKHSTTCWLGGVQYSSTRHGEVVSINEHGICLVKLANYGSIVEELHHPNDLELE